MLYPTELRARGVLNIRHHARAASRVLGYAFLWLALAASVTGLRAETFRSKVTAIEGPLELRLADDRLVRLANIVTPTDTAITATTTWLEQNLAGQAVDIAILDETADRYNRLPVRLFTTLDGADIAQQLVADGLAIVEPQYNNDLDDLFKVESKARTGRRGFWADGNFQITPASLIAAEPPRFAIVEGTVTAVGQGGYYAYLNFGENWREDFTIRLVKDDLEEQFPGEDVTSWVGRSLRIRGWLFDANGPMIQLEHPRQISFLRAAD